MIYGSSKSTTPDDLEWLSRSFTHCRSFQLLFFVQLCSSWQGFNWLRASRGPSATAELLVKTRDIISLKFRFQLLFSSGQLNYHFFSISDFNGKIFLKFKFQFSSEFAYNFSSQLHHNFAKRQFQFIIINTSYFYLIFLFLQHISCHMQW